jgi:peptidoglycan/LPS O-acetylase OafA/YrhL
MKYGEPGRILVMTKVGESYNLDFLRSAAVMFVVVCHILAFFQRTMFGHFNLAAIGQFGVLLFFVHTCLVLMFSLERQRIRDPQREIFGPFYIRRAFRIFPFSMLVVFAVYFFRWPVGHLVKGVFSVEHLDFWGLTSNLLLVQNLTRTNSVIAPLWSLPFEMQMYLVLPLIFLVLRRNRSTLVVTGLWIASLMVSTVHRYDHWLEATDLFTYTPCFMAGVVSYVLTKKWKRNWPFVCMPIILAVLTLFYVTSPSVMRGRICCLLVAIVLPKFCETQCRWLRKASQLIACYSYGIYLTHCISLWFAFAALVREPWEVRWIVFLVLLVVVPVVLYHSIEAPLVSLGSRLTSQRKRERGPQQMAAVQEFGHPQAAS